MSVWKKTTQPGDLASNTSVYYGLRRTLKNGAGMLQTAQAGPGNVPEEAPKNPELPTVIQASKIQLEVMHRRVSCRN